MAYLVTPLSYLQPINALDLVVVGTNGANYEDLARNSSRHGSAMTDALFECYPLPASPVRPTPTRNRLNYVICHAAGGHLGSAACDGGSPASTNSYSFDVGNRTDTPTPPGPSANNSKFGTNSAGLPYAGVLRNLGNVPRSAFIAFPLAASSVEAELSACTAQPAGSVEAARVVPLQERAPNPIASALISKLVPAMSRCKAVSNLTSLLEPPLAACQPSPQPQPATQSPTVSSAQPTHAAMIRKRWRNGTLLREQLN
jgi:hypothetical protein